MNLVDQLGWIEVMIEECRNNGARLGAEGSPERKRYNALRAIAADIRSRLPDERENAIRILQSRIDHVDRTRSALGFESRAMIALAEDVVARWPVIKSALEKHNG